MGCKWIFFWRQMFINSGVWTSYFTAGLCLGYPTVLISQLRVEANSTEVVSEEMASWLPSLCVWASLPWICLLPLAMKTYGRRTLYIFTCITNCIGFIIFFCSQNLAQIAISTLFNGFNFSGYIILITTEYTSPKYRGVFVNFKNASHFWGIWVANALGVYFHWKSIGILAILCCIYSLSIIFVLPESPYWLAQKGKFDESAASYKWLRSSDEETEESMIKMIDYHREHVVNEELVPIFSIMNLKNVFESIKKREFFKPLVLTTILDSLYIFSGKTIISVYAIEILTKVTGGTSSAQSAMLILDGVTVFSTYIGSTLSGYLKRRTLLLTSSTFTNIFLFSTSLYLYLVRKSIIAENNTLSIGLLACFSLSVSVGVIILCHTITCELISLKLRSLSLFFITVTSKFCTAVLIKITPYVLKYFDVHGTLFTFAICSTILLILTYMYVPETKDKSLEEITVSMHTRKRNGFGELKKLISGKRVL